MTNLEKYDNAFINSFNIEKTQLNDNLSNETLDEWDSIGQMTLITFIEEEFNITLETEDLMKFNSYKNGKEILKNYNIKI